MQPSILGMAASAEISAELTKAVVTYSLDPSHAIVDPPGTQCPDIVFSLEMQSGDSLDVSLFKFDIAPRYELTIGSNDISKAGSYPLRLKAQFDGYIDSSSLDFTAILDNPCL